MMNKLTRYLVLILGLCLVIASCKLDKGNVFMKTLTLELTSWDLPDESVVDTPIDLYVSAKTETSCYGKITFVIEVVDGKKYVYASSFYQETEKGCDELITTKDSVLTFAINEVGKHYLYFPKDNKWIKDSIQITD